MVECVVVVVVLSFTKRKCNCSKSPAYNRIESDVDFGEVAAGSVKASHAGVP